ncbi:uncharacterized protein LOC144582626 [Callithrix jacchus]
MTHAQLGPSSSEKQSRVAWREEKAYIREDRPQQKVLFSSIITGPSPEPQLNSKCGHRHISKDGPASSSSAVAGIPALLWHLLPSLQSALCVLRQPLPALTPAQCFISTQEAAFNPASPLYYLQLKR